MSPEKKQRLDLSPEQQATVRQLLERHLPGTEVWAYGSRTKGTAKSCSDLDLVAFVGPEHKAAVADLKEAFEESDLPFRVDLFVWEEVPESFRENIKKEPVVLQQKEAIQGGG